MSKRVSQVGYLLTSLLILASFAGAQTCVEPPAGVVSWWPGDSNAQDIVNGNHGQLRNGATFTLGLVGQAFSLDGVNDFIQIANTASMDVGTGDFTIELWVFFNTLSLQVLLQKETASDRGTYLLELNDAPATALRFLIIDASDPANRNDLSVPVSMKTGQGYHIAAVRDGNTNSVYLDGQLIGAQTAGSAVDTGRGGSAALGRKPLQPVRFLTGGLDEVSLYNRALSAAEIHAIFAADSAGKCKPVGGSVTGVTPGRVMCTNLTTRRTLTLQQHGALSWDCRDAGLVVRPGDRIRQTVTGRAD